MVILVTYDVSTASEGGSRRLRQVAKACLDYGQRVQNSVFECKLEHDDFVFLRKKLLDIINIDFDSIRFYHLGKEWKRRVEHYGAKPGLDLEGPLIV